MAGTGAGFVCLAGCPVDHRGRADPVRRCTMNRATATPQAADGATIDVPMVFGVLLGRRDAILRAARARATIWLGVCFVLAAGLARNYDAHDLTVSPANAVAANLWTL